MFSAASISVSDQRRRISLVRSLNRDCYNRSRLQIHRVFGFVRQMGSAHPSSW